MCSGTSDPATVNHVIPHPPGSRIHGTSALATLMWHLTHGYSKYGQYGTSPYGYSQYGISTPGYSKFDIPPLVT